MEGFRTGTPTEACSQSTRRFHLFQESRSVVVRAMTAVRIIRCIVRHARVARGGEVTRYGFIVRRFTQFQIGSAFEADKQEEDQQKSWQDDIHRRDSTVSPWI